jgi:hypothetical protein
MNILLWILQVALALFSFMGGQYKLFHFDELATMPQTAALALEALALAVLFAQYSLALTATNPLCYVVVMGLVAAFVAYGRFTLRTLV